MVLIAIILLAALPHTDNPRAHSAFIALSVLCIAEHFRNQLQALANNQGKLAELIKRTQ